MKKNDSQPIDKNFICSNQLEKQISDLKESVPFFLLPFGFHSLSLFQIAQYYDGSAKNFYQNIIFPNSSTNDSDTESLNFAKYKIFDYSQFFIQIFHNFQVPNSIQSCQYINLCDRYFDINFFLSLQPLGDTSFISYHIPKGNEDGIAYILSQTRNFLRPHLFSLMSVPFSSISAKITITTGQPFLFNKILSSNYSNVDSINSRKESLVNDINALKQKEFQIDWSIVSINGLASLILVRPPQYLRIGDRSLEIFDSLDKAFENSNIYLVCYRHSQFIKRMHFEISEKSSKIDHHISSDSFFCNMLKNEMGRSFNQVEPFDFESYLIYSLRFPSFYLMNCGFEKEIAMAASVFIDDPKGRAATYFIPLLKSLIKKDDEKANEAEPIFEEEEEETENQNFQKNSYPEENAPAPAFTPLEVIDQTENSNKADNQNNINNNTDKTDGNDKKEDDNNNTYNSNKDNSITNDNNKTSNDNTDNNDDHNKIKVDDNSNHTNNDTEGADNDDISTFYSENINVNMSQIIVSPFQDQVEVESKLLSVQITQLKSSIQEYYKFTFWLRSFISVLKSIRRRDLIGITNTSLSCFRSLPLRNRRVLISTILTLVESLKMFRKQRGQNDEFFQRVLRIFKSVFGEEFDHILGLQKWEIPREMRRQVVSIDSCVKMFYIRSFQNEKISINNVIFRLKKYMDPIMKEISFDQDVPSFKFCQSYIDFLKLQKFEKIIEI